MTQSQFAHIDEEGRMVLPQEVAAAWGLRPGERLKVEDNLQGLQVHPPANTLRRVYLEITNQCNLNCSTCMRNVWAAGAGFMDMATFTRILDDLETFSPRPELFFGGYGEPLSHPECLEMLREAKQRGFRVLLISNGILLGEAVRAALLEIPLEMLWVSLDGASPECYIDVRLGDALPTILKNLQALRTLQYQRFGFSETRMVPRLGIAFVAMKRNVHDLLEVIRLGTQMGAAEFSITNVLAHNRSLQGESLYECTMDQMYGNSPSHWRPLIHLPRMDVDGFTEEMITQLLKSGSHLEFMGGKLRMDGDQCPFVERGSLAIRWDGKVSPCLPLLYTHTYYLGDRERTSHETFVGDLGEKGLSDIWAELAYQALRQRLLEFDFPPCTTCNSCEMADQNLEDCYGNTQPACGGCLWAQGVIRCP